MKFIAISFALIACASAQIFTQIGPDGYKYAKPVARLDLPETAPACPNGGSGEFCCINGATNVDCCDNGGKGEFCCTNGADNVNCDIPTPPPVPDFVPTPPSLPKVIKVEPIQPFIEGRSFIQEVDKEEPIAALPEILPKVAATTTVSPNEYLPPDEYLPPAIDARTADIAVAASDWVSWKVKYGKNYLTKEEDSLRQAIFEKNTKLIIVHNEDFSAGLVTFDLEQNKFTDLTQDEFVAAHTGLARESRSIEGQDTLNVFMPSPILEAEVEDEVDWRKKGAVTAVKNQGNCASCWAFAANGALEAQNFLKTGKLVSLSEQNLIDCVKENDGCSSGYMTNAYSYVRENPGVDTEDSYPYEAKNATCRFDPANVGGECIAHMEIMLGNEVALRQAVAMVGPVAAGVDASKHSFQFYKSGYFFEPRCATDVNHAVLIVGYGKTDAGQEYWICKNSWDTDWGEEGYILMARNKNNHCGITSLASYPLV